MVELRWTKPNLLFAFNKPFLLLIKFNRVKQASTPSKTKTLLPHHGK